MKLKQNQRYAISSTKQHHNESPIKYQTFPKIDSKRGLRISLLDQKKKIIDQVISQTTKKKTDKFNQYDLIHKESKSIKSADLIFPFEQNGSQSERKISQKNQKNYYNLLTENNEVNLKKERIYTFLDQATSRRKYIDLNNFKILKKNITVLSRLKSCPLMKKSHAKIIHKLEQDYQSTLQKRKNQQSKSQLSDRQINHNFHLEENDALKLL